MPGKDARSSGKSRQRDKDREKERDREKKKDKDRDKDRDKDKDRHREKESRDGHRERDKDRKRDDEKEKNRDKEREREKNRHRDNDKDRERKKDRESESSRDKDRERKKDRERESSREKDRERRRDRESESSRDKERERRKDRESASAKDKERSKHRGEDGQRVNERSKDRDRQRDRDGDRERREKSHRDKRDGKDREGSGRHRDTSKDKRRDRSKEKHRDRSREKQREERERDRHRDKEDRHREKDKERKKNRENGEEDKEKRREERRREKEKDRKRDKEGMDSDREKRRPRDKDGSADSRRRERRQEKEEFAKEEEPVEEHAVENSHEENNNYEYEDDFEDYDDDFEEDDDEENEEDEEIVNHHDGKVSSEIDELRKAMDAENQAMRRSADSQSSRARSERSSASSSRPTTSRTGRTFINFVAAKQREISDQVSQRTRKRGQELMSLIDLDATSYDIFDMPPVREYDRYISSFGRSNTKQAFVQCNDDNLEREIQTEDVEGWDKWTQHPAEGTRACGGTTADGDEDKELAAEKESYSLHFSHFMEKATQLFTVLLDEEMANRVGSKLESNKRSIVFSDGYTLMNTGTPILQGRCITKVVCHPVQTNLILTMHTMPKKKVVEKAGLTNRGLMCVWNVNEPSRPQKILVLKSVPTTCNLSPAKATMAFCGTADGSVCVWDLREPSNMHQKCEFGWGHMVVRVPTYSTEAGTPDESHQSAVVAMQPIVTAEDAKSSTTKKSSYDDADGMSFQLASVDERGTISFWVVLEIDKPDEAGSESDLGLVPSGKIKLIKSSSIQLHVPSRELGPVYEMKIADMQLMPTNPNHFFVTTDAGFISHGARNTERVSPKYYWVNEGIPVSVKFIDFSPFDLPCYLVACGDGSVHLFMVDRGKPLVSWPNATQGMDITAIQWSRSRPSVFYVMDITSKVYVWELLDNDSGPAKTEQFNRGKLTTLCVANDHAATGWGVAGRKPEMIIADDTGSLDVHQLNSRFTSAEASELDEFTSFLEQLI